MKLTDALIEIGAALPSVVDPLLCEDAATALETVRRAACTGAGVVLKDPPPALVHESKLPSANLLYGARRPCPVDAGAYDSIPDFDGVVQGQCLGALMMDVTRNAARPAIFFADTDEAGKWFVKAYVHDAPLAAMEAELFGGGLPSGFECKWLGAQAKSAKELRRQCGEWVRCQGYEAAPEFLLDAERYVVLERPGVLPLLRVRAPASDEEEEIVKQALQRWTTAGGFALLKDLVGDIDFVTVFVQGPERETREDNCEPTLNQPLIGALALAILKQLTDGDYWGVESEGEGEEGSEGEEGGDEHAAAQKLVDELEVRESGVELRHEGLALAYRGEKILNRLIGPTLRACDSKTLLRSQSELDAAHAVIDAAFCSADAVILKDRTQTRDFLESIVEFARHMGTRHAVMLLTKADDGTLVDCRLVSHEGERPLRYENVTRYVLCPWVLPILRGGGATAEIKIQGVVREQFRLTEQARIDAVYRNNRNTHQQAPEELTQFLREASEKLNALPELARRVDLLIESAGSSATPVAALPMSETQRGLKRIIAQLEAFEDNE
jgi:hypothetical protein